LLRFLLLDDGRPDIARPDPGGRYSFSPYRRTSPNVPNTFANRAGARPIYVM
jgi:hypothetical protein